MRYAFGLLGLAFVITIGSAYFLIDRAPQPAREAEIPLTYESNHDAMMTLTSTAFEEGAPIPERYTCEGNNINPELRIAGAPEGTVSFALIMEDPDIPASVKQQVGTEVFDHWVVFNMPAGTEVIEEGQKVPGTEGMNTVGPGYTGPCPPDKEHRYIFTLYALDTVLQLNAAATKSAVLAAISGHELARATLTGTYEKHNQ